MGGEFLRRELKKRLGGSHSFVSPHLTHIAAKRRRRGYQRRCCGCACSGSARHEMGYARVKKRAAYARCDGDVHYLLRNKYGNGVRGC